MYPDLSYFMHDMFGTQPDNAFSIIKTFGLFLVISFLTAAAILHKEILRKEKEGLLHPVKKTITEGLPATPFELFLNAIFGFIFGAKLLYAIQNFEDFKIDAAATILSANGSLLGGILGAVLFVGLKYWEKKSVQVSNPQPKTIDVWPHDRISDITIVAVVGGLIGAKVFALIEDLPAFFADPFGMFFSGSGMAIYGGLIGGFLIGYIYLKMIKITPIHIMDAVAPALILTYGIGRLGCHFSGDGDWGIVNTIAQPSWFFLPDWAWSYDYPNNYLNEGVPIEGCDWRFHSKLAAGVFPTSIWEFIMACFMGAFLWAIRKKVQIAGMLFSIYLFINGLERYFIEKIRVNDRYEIFGFESTQAQIIAMMLMLFGILGGLISWHLAKRDTTETEQMISSSTA